MPPKFAKGKASDKLGFFGVKWTPEFTTKDDEAHATEIYTGPKGAGKSALACKRVYMFSKGLIRGSRGFCLCEDESCDAKWTVYTNLESPTLPEYGAWAKPLDLASQLIDTESDDRHAIIWIDEAPQFFDSRRGMLTEVLKMLKQVTMLRKKKMRLVLTAIDWTWLDKRIRDQANVVYNCWTENKAVTVNAIVYRLATGNIAPWLRHNIPPEIKWWWCTDIRNKYNTDELVNADDLINATRTENMVFVKDSETGQVTPMTLSEMLSKVVGSMVREETFKTDEVEIMEIVLKRYGMPTSKGAIREVLIDAGFPRDEKGKFIIFTGEVAA